MLRVVFRWEIIIVSPHLLFMAQEKLAFVLVILYIQEYFYAIRFEALHGGNRYRLGLR